MNKHSQMEDKVVKILDLSLKHINKRTVVRLQYIRNNALEHLEPKDKLMPDGKSGHIFAALGWRRYAAKILFSVLFLLLLAWASITWQLKCYPEDHSTADSNYLTDDSANDSILDDHHKTWRHTGYSKK